MPRASTTRSGRPRPVAQLLELSRGLHSPDVEVGCAAEAGAGCGVARIGTVAGPATRRHGGARNRAVAAGAGGDPRGRTTGLEAPRRWRRPPDALYRHEDRRGLVAEAGRCGLFWPVWVYRPRTHKNQRRGQKREIMMGPKRKSSWRPLASRRRCLLLLTEGLDSGPAGRWSQRLTGFLRSSDVCQERQASGASENSAIPALSNPPPIRYRGPRSVRYRGRTSSSVTSR